MIEVRHQIALHPRQLQALDTEATELLFGGASRGGKSHFAREALIYWCLLIPGLQCKIFRKFSDDVVSNHMDSATGFRALLAGLVRAGVCTIVNTPVPQVRFHDNGSLISLHHCQNENDLEKHQGRATHVLVLDEATQLSERIITFLRGWVTMTQEMKAKLPEEFRDRFPRIIYTANPIGVSVGYFRRHFVKARPAFKIEEVGAFKRQYIPSRVQDNPSESADALKGRVSEMDQTVARALYDGDWDAPLGDFFPEWDERRHVIKDFTPPRHWYRFGSFDWGTAEPFAVYWWAVSDGESFMDDMGNQRWYPKGAIIAYREWYGCDEEKPANGIRWRNEDIAYGMVQRSVGEGKIVFVTDSLPFQDRGGKTIAETMKDCGVSMIHGDTSRVSGWSQLRSRLIGAKIDSNDEHPTPMMFFVESCRYARDYLPALPRHPQEHKREDAAEHGEATHAPDAIRLACTSRPIVKQAPIKPPDTTNLRNKMTFEQALKRVQRQKASTRGSSW